MANKNKQSNDKIDIKLTETNKKNTQLGETIPPRMVNNNKSYIGDSLNFTAKMVQPEKKNSTNKPKKNKVAKVFDRFIKKKSTKDK